MSMEISSLNEVASNSQPSEAAGERSAVQNGDVKIEINGGASRTSDMKGLEITREDVKANQDGIKTSRKTKERVAEIHNTYVRRIFASCGQDLSLQAIGMEYAEHLPKASRGNDIQEFKHACEAQYNAFLAAVRDAGLSENMVILDENMQARQNELIEQMETNTEAVNQHTTEVGAQVTENVNNHTTEVGAQVIRKVNRHIDSAKYELEKDISGAEYIVIQQQRQDAVLQAKRQTLSDLLTTEQVEVWPGTGHYRDTTVQWLGSAADRVLADNELSFRQKKEAMDELIRMVDKEIIISAQDRSNFENKYFRDIRVHEHDTL